MTNAKTFQTIATILDANKADLPLVQDFADLCADACPEFGRDRFVAMATEELRETLQADLSYLDMLPAV